jgi:hypothetical protein
MAYSRQRLLDSDLDELSQEQENQGINTLAIFKKIQEQERLYASKNTLSRILCRENAKYSLHAGAALVGMVGIAGFALFLSKFLRLPTLAQESQQENQAAIWKYANTSIKSLNSTCGVQIPVGNVSVCRDLSVFGNGIDNDAFQCARRISHFPYVEELISVFKRECWDAPIDYCQFNVSNITDTAQWYCKNYIEDICKYLIYSNFSRPIEPNNYSCADKFVSLEVFLDCSLAAEDVCEHTRNYNISSKDWWDYDRAMTFTLALLGFIMVTCTGLYVMCKATSWVNKKEKMSELPEEIQDEIESAFDICTLTTQAYQEIYPDEYQENERNDDNAIPGDLKIIQAWSLLDKNIQNIQQEKQLLSDMRFAFLIGRENPSSSVPANLPNDVARKIFYFAGLFSKPPIEKDLRLEPKMEAKHLAFAS